MRRRRRDQSLRATTIRSSCVARWTSESIWAEQLSRSLFTTGRQMIDTTRAIDTHILLARQEGRPP